MKDEKRPFIIEKKDIIDYARLHYKELQSLNATPWNGRQIRNAFQTAMALAEYDAHDSTPRLNRAQFAKVAETSKQFDFYLKTVWGRDDAEVARQDQARNDEISAEDLIVATTVPKRSAVKSAIPTVTTAGKGKTPAFRKTVLQPQQYVPEAVVSDHSSDDDDLDTEEEELEVEDEMNEPESEEKAQRRKVEVEGPSEKRRKNSVHVKEERAEGSGGKKQSRGAK
jgi:hypothetical protein